LGSCTGNSIAKAVQFDVLRQVNLTPITPSRLFIYYNERVMEGTVDQDSGAQIRDGIKTIATLGVCDESMWPYDTNQFAVKPPDTCYNQATQYKASAYYSIDNNLGEMKDCLAQGHPFVFGFNVFDGFESDTVAVTGVVPMPTGNEAAIGGHAVLAIGYIDGPLDTTIGGQAITLSQVIIVQNSWGDGWGDGGYFYMPYSYISNPGLADDMWAILTIT
jgi:C1A family cysteine protease